MSATATPTRFAGNTTIREIIPIYFRYGSPRLLAAYLVIMLTARIWYGQWSWWDLVAVAAMLALQPFTEWVIHTFVLHFRPKNWFGRKIDLYIAHEHRRHHRDPKDIALVFIPFRVLAIGLPIEIVAVMLLVPWKGVALTLLLTQAVIGNVYEWTHFYIHSGCKPRNRYAAYIERAHRLHHYRNEQFWMGVTVHTADHVLGTFPDKDSVPVSPTAKTLGID